MAVRSGVVQSAAAALIWCGLSPALAQTEIYLCVDAEGQKTYTNTPISRSCKRVENQPLITVPAPKAQQRPPAGAVQPANFPRVDRDTQRTRDTDRRQLLEEELKIERDKMFRLRSEFNSGEPERRGDERNYGRYQERVARLQEDIQRTEANISSLNRELAALRQ